MILHVEAGHGDGYRTPGQFDFGLFADSGACEAVICREYAQHLRILAERRGHCANISLSGNIAARLSKATSRKADMLVSFHLDGDPSGISGGRVLYGRSPVAEIAGAIGAAISLPVEAVAADGLLAYIPAVEIRLGNIASWKDTKALASCERCDQICTQILDALDRLYASPRP